MTQTLNFINMIDWILRTINRISSRINMWCYKMIVRRKYYRKKDDD